MDKEKPIVLTGVDALAFWNAISNPSEEDIKRNEQYRKRIENNISIEKIHDGYEVTITDLDLFQ